MALAAPHTHGSEFRMHPPQPIIILAPTRGELLPTVRRLELIAEGPAYRGARRGAALLAAATGIGRDRTRQAVEQVLRHHRPRALMLIGFAGALDPALPTAKVVHVAAALDETGRRFTLHANASSQAALSSHDGADPSPFAAFLSHTLPAAVALSVNRVVSTQAMKRDLRQRFPEAALVDMESAALAAFAAERAVPLVILRAVSDAADAALPAELLQCVTPDGSTDLRASLRLLLRRPTLLPAMVRLGLTSRTAAANLAVAVPQVLDAIAESPALAPGFRDQSVK